jgi:prefoldin subunit 5
MEEYITLYLPYVITALFILSEASTVIKTIKQSKLIKLFDNIKLGNDTKVDTILDLSHKVNALQAGISSLTSKSTMFDKAEAKFKELLDRFDVVENVLVRAENIVTKSDEVNGSINQAIDEIKRLYGEMQPLKETIREVAIQRAVLNDVAGEIRKFNTRMGVK